MGFWLAPLVMAIGCGSLWREVQARSFSELSVDLQEWIELNDPHREEVQGLLEAGWMAAYEGRIGMLSAIGFEVAFERAVSDKAIDEPEIRELRRRAAAFRAGTPAEGDPRRVRLLALKAQMDAEVKVERTGVVRRRRGRSSDGSGISDWLLPDDVRDATESAGWEVQGTCRDDEIDGIQFVFCEAKRGPLVANVKMDRYPKEEEAREVAGHPTTTAAVHQEGDTVLTVAVIDGTAGEALAGAIVARGDSLLKLSAAPVQASIKGGGWDLEGCDAHKEGRTITVSCEAHQTGRQALVDLVVHRGSAADPETEERVVSSGEASVVQGRNYLKATVFDANPARELANAILE